MNELATTGQNLQRRYTKAYAGETGGYDISVFSKQAPASDNDIVNEMARLSIAFPQVEPRFWGLLSEEVRKAQWSQQRIEYAVTRILHEHTYTTLTMADILRMDSKIKVYTFDEIYRKYGTTQVAGYCIIKRRDDDGRVLYATIHDAEAAGVEIQTKFY